MFHNPQLKFDTRPADEPVPSRTHLGLMLAMLIVMSICFYVPWLVEACQRLWYASDQATFLRSLAEAASATGLEAIIILLISFFRNSFRG